MYVNLLQIVQRGFPIYAWSKEYNIDKAIADLVAGITIGLTLIPQVIAYASLAGLGPQYGLYSSLCGGIIYAIFGTIPELNIAPTALVSLLTFSFTNEVGFGNVTAAVLLCFLAGIIELLCGFLHLGFLVDFVSTPVVAAFTSAGALTIASSQVKNLLGLHYTAENFISVWTNVFSHISETQKWDAILGISCCVILLLMRKLKDFGSPPLEGKEEKTEKAAGLKKFIWFISVARNALVVISCAIMAFVFDNNDSTPFSLTSHVPQGLPSVVNPITDFHDGNKTVTSVEMMKELGAGIFVVPFVAILSNVAIAKAFSRGKVVDASQEMIAVGLCNVFGSFFGSYPVSASFSRAAVSNQSGVKTPIAGLYTAAMVILALTFLTPYFPYIPKPTLAAVIICAVIFMVEATLTKMIWRIKKIDLVPFTVTFICCLFVTIEIGILAGVCVDLIFLLYEAARPKVLIEKMTTDSSTDYIKVIPTSSILFPSAEYIREKIMQTNERHGFHCIIIDCHRVNKVDFTAAKCLAAFISDLKKVGKSVIFYQPKKSVAKVLQKVTDGASKIVETEDELLNVLKENNHLNCVSSNVEMNFNNNKDNPSVTQL